MFEATMLKDLSAKEMLTAVEELHRAVMERENFILVMACDWADRHAPESATDAGQPTTPGGETARRFGGEGTPEVLEFAPTELGLPLRISAYSANQLMADALDLRHRLPLLWQRVVAGEVEAWKARKVAAATRHLSAFAARLVDEAVSETITRQSWSRFKKLMDAKIIEADPDLAQSRADREARARYVRTGRASHGMMSMTVRGPAADVLGVEALIERLARIYAAMGDESDLDTRRSKAFLDYRTPQTMLATLAASEGVDLSAFDAEAFADTYGPTAGSGPDDTTNASTEPSDTPEPSDTTGYGDTAGSGETAGSGDATRSGETTGTGKTTGSGKTRRSGDATGTGEATGPGDRAETAGADDAGADNVDADGPSGQGAAADHGPGHGNGRQGEDELEGSLSLSKGRPTPHRGGGDDHDSPTDPTADHEPSTPPAPSGPPGGPGSRSGESSAHTGSQNPEPRASSNHAGSGTTTATDPATPERTDDHQHDTGEHHADAPDPPGPQGQRENSVHNHPSTSSGHENTGTGHEEIGSGHENTGPGHESTGQGHDEVGPSPQMARRILTALASSGLDPEKVGPQYTVYAHFASEHLTYNGPVRLEGVGPQTLQQFINQLDPLARVTVKPVLDLATQVMPVDGYEIPAMMRELHHLTSPGDKFPFSPTTGRRMDIDHTLHYIPIDQGGPAGQTSQTNTGPLARFSHRVRTHGGMTPRQPRPGTYVWRSRNGYVSITDHRGTYNLGTDAFADAVWHAAVDLNAERNAPDSSEAPRTTLPADDAATDGATAATYLQHPEQATITLLLDHYADFYGAEQPDPTDQEFDDDWPVAPSAA